jgi:hypothetical protein
MKKEKIYRTDYRCFTSEEAEKQFKELVSVLNWELLSLHITDPFLSTFIEGFTEQNGTLFFLVDDEMTSVTYNLSHPRFSN